MENNKRMAFSLPLHLKYINKQFCGTYNNTDNSINNGNCNGPCRYYTNLVVLTKQSPLE